MSLTAAAYRRIKAHLGVGTEDDPAPNTAMEVIPHPDVLSRLGVDCISVRMGEAGQRRGDSQEAVVDAWGVRRALVRQAGGGEYYEAVSHPLARAGRRDLQGFPWPSPAPAAKGEALRAHAAGLSRQTDLALVGRFGGPVLELAADLLGPEEWYIRTADDPDFIRQLLDRISGICTADDLFGVESAGEYLQIVKVSGEDLGMQTGPLYSMRTFCEVLLPPLERRWRAVRKKLEQVNPAAKVMLHSCGSIRSFIPAMIEAGIDILNPVQPLAAGMGPSALMEEHGGRLVFHGGIDIQDLLTRAAPEVVARETRRCLEAFHAERGGFIAAPSHTVQSDVPPENVVAMIDAVKGWRP